MATRKQIYDYSIAEELPDGTVRYWMEDQWQAAHGDFEGGPEKHESLGWSQMEKYFLVVGKVFGLVVKAIAILTWNVLRITWKVFWFLFFVFCFQSLFGRAISKL